MATTMTAASTVAALAPRTTLVRLPSGGGVGRGCGTNCGIATNGEGDTSAVEGSVRPAFAAIFNI
jgi:hypothetical protein